MKVLLLTTHLDSGGITSYLVLLTKGLIKNGHQVHIASAGGQLEHFFEDLGAKLKILNIRTKSELDTRIHFSLFPLLQYIKKEGIDIIHSQTRITQVMGRNLQKLTGVPYCSTCHGYFKARLSRKLFPCWGDRVIAISPAVKDHLVNDFNVESNKVALIPHGIDILLFPPPNDKIKRNRRKKYNLNGDIVVGIIARLSDVKGHDILINAMKDVVEKIPKTKLLIFGEGKAEANLKTLVGKLNLKDHVVFYPIVNKTSEVLPIFDVFVMPSIQEGLGLSVMEAQACGIPVVASKIGGLTTLVEDGKTGLLVEPKDVKGLSEAIIKLIENRKLASQIGMNARDYISEEHTSDKMIDCTIAVYKEMAGQKV